MKAVVLASLALLLMNTPLYSQEPLRVACVGDSITYGDKILFRSFRSYPAVLEKLSDGRLVTGNFGVNAMTALDVPGRAWIDTAACGSALLFQPDIVIVMLGINDLFFPDLYNRYPADLRAIVERFQALPSSPRLFLCTLTPLAPADVQEQANQTIRTVFNPAIRRIAAETGADVIDIHAVFPATLEFLPDSVHPSPEGAALIARTVLDAIETSPAAPPKIQPAPASGPVDLSIRNEAFAARRRATRWLEGKPLPVDLPDPAAQWEGRTLHSPDEVAGLLPLLAGEALPDSGDPYRSMAALAVALDAIGHETVFLDGDRPVAWREAVLHQLVQRQQMDAQGRGFWVTPGPSNPPEEALRSTTYALQALRIALGE